MSLVTEVWIITGAWVVLGYSILYIFTGAQVVPGTSILITHTVFPRTIFEDVFNQYNQDESEKERVSE